MIYSNIYHTFEPHDTFRDLQELVHFFASFCLSSDSVNHGI